MTRFYDIDEANAALPSLEGILVTLASQRDELVRLRDEALAADKSGDGLTGEALRLARLRMQGLVDQMAAGVARIEGMSITLRDIPDGLVDFPALVNGRQVWLCWRRGEGDVGYWHTLDSGFSGRLPLSEMV
jgi:hypothetical protein